MIADAEPLAGAQRMVARAIGEDQLAAGQRRDAGGERHVGLDRSAVDVMDEAQELRRIDAVFVDQPTQSGAMLAVIEFLQRARRHAIEAKHAGHEDRHAIVDARPQIAVGRIKRVVEVEHPCIDMGETLGQAFRRHHQRLISVPAP